MGTGANGDAGSQAGPSHVMRTGELQLRHRESPTIRPFHSPALSLRKYPIRMYTYAEPERLLLNNVRVSRHICTALQILKACRNGSSSCVTSSREEYAACDIGTRYVGLRARAPVEILKGRRKTQEVAMLTSPAMLCATLNSFR